VLKEQIESNHHPTLMKGCKMKGPLLGYNFDVIIDTEGL